MDIQSTDIGYDSIDLGFRDFIPFKGFKNYCERNIRFTNKRMSDYQAGYGLRTGINKTLLFTYNASVTLFLTSCTIVGLEKILN